MSERVRIPIEGMTCTSCVARITKAVRPLAGVEAVRVELTTDSASVAFDPTLTSLAVIGAAIEKAGYAPRLDGAEPISETAFGQPKGLLGRFGLGS